MKANFGILVTHGNLGDELIQTIKMISGQVNNMIAVSNTDLSLRGLISRLDERIAAVQDKAVFILVEMIGGSPYMAGRKVAAKYENVYFISGVNIPMLLSFNTKSGHMPAEELADLLKKDAIRGIECIKSVGE